MKLIISGSRPHPKFRTTPQSLRQWYDQHRNVVNEAVAQSGLTISDIEEVVSGKSKGFDLLGESWAAENHIPVMPFPADWQRFGKPAGFFRNKQMADYADALVAITYGTPGTRNMIQTMRELDKPVFVLDLRARPGRKPYPSAHAQPGRSTEPGRECKAPTIGPMRREHAGEAHQP